MRHLLGRDLSHGRAIDPGLIERWARGWATSRGKPIAHDGAALRIDIDEPDQRRRFVFTTPPDGIAEIAAANAEPLVFLKAPMAEARVRALLPPAWRVARTGTFMTLADLPHAAAPPPAGFALTLVDDGAVTYALVLDDGQEPVARGRLVIVDGLAIHDRVRTEPAFERRGLGRAVMTALGAVARQHGARQGALAATDIGLLLYRTPGWIARSPYVTAEFVGG